MPTLEDPTEDQGAAVPDQRAPRWAAGHVLIAVVIALVVGTLLNAQALLATAERQPFGWARDTTVAMIRPVARVSAAIGLDRPHEAITTALGRGADDAGAPSEVGPIVAQPSVPTTTTPPDTTATGSGSTPSEAASATAEPPSGPMGLDRGPVTAEDPLQLYIGGDSLVEIQFGTVLESLADDTGMIDTLRIDADRGSGLARPDFIDWPARLAKVTKNLDPDIMVVYFGGNDAQPLKIDGTVYQPDEPEWQAEYSSRVADLMEQLSEAGVHVYWMGLPIPRAADMVTKYGMLNDIFDAQASQRDAITFVPVWELFTGPDGKYAEYLPNENGDEVDMRIDDGIHLTTNGARLAARPVIAQIIEDFDIPPSDDG